ncbi:rhomboid family intramembrane serine protease [Nocardioides salsibiostraticola]
MSSTRTAHEPATWVRAGVHVGAFVALLWVLEIVDAVLPRSLDQYGVQPRSDEGLVGILFAPVLHAGFDHLVSNTLPVIVLGFLVFVSGISQGWTATAIIWVVGGIGVWLIAPGNEVHLGASVLVFGWLVYLIVRGAFTRNAGQIILGLVLVFLYGGLLFGVLPGQPGVSWQGHLFGAIGGGLAAAMLSDRTPSRRK